MKRGRHLNEHSRSALATSLLLSALVVQVVAATIMWLYPIQAAWNVNLISVPLTVRGIELSAEILGVYFALILLALLPLVGTWLVIQRDERWLSLVLFLATILGVFAHRQVLQVASAVVEFGMSNLDFALEGRQLVKANLLVVVAGVALIWFFARLSPSEARFDGTASLDEDRLERRF